MRSQKCNKHFLKQPPLPPHLYAIAFVHSMSHFIAHCSVASTYTVAPTIFRDIRAVFNLTDSDYQAMELAASAEKGAGTVRQCFLWGYTVWVNSPPAPSSWSQAKSAAMEAPSAAPMSVVPMM